MTIEYKDSKRIVGLSSDRTQGLKAYYHFEDNGTNAQTTNLGLGSSADMTVTGATYVTGKVGSKAISFDGTNDHAVIGSSTSDFNFLANTTHEWTVAFWLKNDDFSSLGMILSTAVELGSSRFGLGIRAQSSGSIYVHFCNGTNQNRFTTTQTGFSTDGNWHFIVITAKKSDSTNSLEFWQDGISLGTASNSGKDFVNTNASQAPYIGQAGDSSQYLDGALDELSIWNRRLSDSEISTLYNSGTGIVIGSTDIAVGDPLTNVQDNSLFVTKDTARRYWCDNTPSVTNQDIEWTNGSGVTISGNTVTATTNGWGNGIARSVQTISPSRGGGEIIGQKSLNYAMIGLSKDPYWTSGDTFVNGNYMMYHDGIYELGTEVDSFTAGSNSTNYKITMDSNGLVKYFVDNGSGYSEVYESTVTAGSNVEYYALATPYNSGNTVSGTITGKLPTTWTSSSGISKSGCLIQYNFDQTSGNATNLATTANGFTDGLGSTGDGVNSGATTGQIGKIDNAWSFDGTNDQVDSGSSSDLILTGDMTWAAWVNINTTTSSKVITVASIRGDAGSNTEADNTLFSFFIVQNSSPPTLRVFHENGAGTNNQVDFTTSLSEDTWYHIVFTRDVSEKTVKCYIDGSLHGSGTYSNNPTTTTSTLPLRTGGNNFSGAAASDGHFNGLLDEVSLWNRVLTADEISKLYNSGNGVGV